MLRKCIVIALLVGLCGTAPAFGAADLTLSFDRITSNSPVNVASQLSVEVMDLGSGSVQFAFINAGPITSSITQVYFGVVNPVLLSFAGVTVPSDWGVGASPAHLPGLPPGEFPVAFSAGADSPVAPNGINAGESGAFTFDLASGVTFGELSDALESGDLAIGIHVQRLPDAYGGTDESDSFVTRTPVPVPAAVYLGALGFGLVAFARRKRFG